MRRALSLFLFGLLVFGGAALGAEPGLGPTLSVSSKFYPARAQGIERSYIIVLDEANTEVALRYGSGPRRLAAVASSVVRLHGGEVVRVWDRLVGGFLADMTESEARALARDSRVKYVFQDRFLDVDLAAVPQCYPDAPVPFAPFDPTNQSSQPINCSNPAETCSDNWGLDRIDQREGASPTGKSFNFGDTTGESVHVYVLDTGIQANHSEFAGRIGGGANFTTDSGTDDCYPNSHGTHVAAIIGGSTFGIAKDVILHPVKAMGPCPMARTTVSWLVSSLEWISAAAASDDGPSVVNFSSNIRRNGPQADGTLFDDAALVTINNAFQDLAREVPVVNSAGNFNADACTYHPTSVPELIVAGGSSIADARWADSSFGSNYGACVDLFAPAVDILSASNFETASRACRLTGTSMAAPHVTGVIALYLQDHPDATPEQVTQALLDNATTGRLSGIGPGSPDRLLYSVFGTTVPPCVIDDARTTPLDTCLNILASEMQANDCSEAEFVRAENPQHGTLEIAGIGPEDIVYRYCPPAGFVGADSFQYLVQGSDGGQATGTVNITVTGTIVVAHPDHLMGRLDTLLRFKASDLTANDTPGVEFIHAEDPSQGTLSIAGIGPEDVLYDYVPPPGFVGEDTFEYLISATGNEPYVRGLVTITVEDWPPDAAMSVNCSGLSCTFTSTSTDDGGVVSRAWTFGDGATATGSSVSHAYALASSYEAALTVTDTAGQTSTATQIVTVDAIPVAAFTVNCSGRTCTFDASGSTDDVGITSYAWSFGDGTMASGVTVTHTYSASGNFPVTLTVTDTTGQTDSEGPRTVSIDLDPSPCFTWSRDGLTINFNASCSTDDVGISTYAWTFGDGTTGSGKIVSHAFATSGSFSVVLTVTDSGSHGRSTPPTPVTPDAKPVANFTWSCTQRTCTFNGTSSTDNAPIVTWEWTLGDGNVKYGSIVNHTYAVGGPYNVKLKVTDSVNQWDDEPKQIGVKRPPVAVNDSVSTPPGVAIDINVLTNDSDPDSDPLTVTGLTTPTHGTVTLNGNGTVRYTPAAGNLNPATFQYRAQDVQDVSNLATVTVTLNNPPDARDDGWAAIPGNATNIPYSHLLANDYDPNGDPLTVTGVNTAGLIGTLDCSSGTYCRYTAPGFQGATSFTYTASDGKGGTDTATVRIKVGMANGLPVPQDDILETAYNTNLIFTRDTLLLNDSDPNGDVLSITSVYRAPLTALGTVSCSAAHYVCTYTPPAGFTGVDVLWYRASDGIGFTDARIRILVRPPSPAVLDAREDQTFFTSSGGTFLSYTWMTSNDYDPEGGALTVVSVDTTGLLGSLDCATYPNGCQYTRGTSDPTRFRYTVRDPQGNLATTTVTLKPGNWSFNLNPVIASDQLSTRTNTPLVFSAFDVLRNDYDPDNDQLAVSFYFASPNGRVICSTPAYVCTYTPNTNFTGTDMLTYYANDGNNAISGSVTMTVLPVAARDAQILSQSVPVSMFAGQSYPVSLRIKNVGTQTWSPIGSQCNAFRLGSVNPYNNTTWNTGRTELPAAVPPGGEVTLSFTVTAPTTPGTYNFQRQMVQECVMWFGDSSPNVVVSVSP